MGLSAPINNPLPAKHIIQHLEQKQLTYPALILTSEVLFSEETPQLHRYIEITENRQHPKLGPQVVGIGKEGSS
jgi:hypothetical protein